MIGTLELTLESTVTDMFNASTPEPGSDATALRLVAFDPSHIALVFNGPEAEILSMQFVRYAEALIDTLTDKVEALHGPQALVDAGLR
jgi:hypothetical protein